MRDSRGITGALLDFIQNPLWLRAVLSSHQRLSNGSCCPNLVMLVTQFINDRNCVEIRESYSHITL